MEPPDCRRIGEEEPVFLQYLLKKKVPADWNVRYETPAGKAWTRETPQANAEEASRTARGKRVPGVEIITHTHFRKSAPFRRLPASLLAGKRLRLWGLG
ncbi:hypothetical protein ACIP97_09020 [Peribacillus frigoritolerans]|uniref:hypothetical protein n=1 Tax=Peribacillus frigoritolerans TaxID=450367 RepID=UPI0037F3C2B4